MSLSAPCIAVRNMLRSSLTNFYDNTDSAIQTKLRKASCRVMPDERVAPSAGREFIGVYCSAWEPIQTGGGDSNLWGFHEQVTITVALTHRYTDVPYDRLGEAAYLADEDVFIQQYTPLSQRLREIVVLIHKDYTTFKTEMDALLSVDVSSVAHSLELPYDKLWFSGCDAKPRIVGPDHFFASSSDKNPVSGLMMRANFKGSMRLHTMETLDYYAT